MEGANYDQLEKTLTDNNFIGGYFNSIFDYCSQLPTAADSETFDKVKSSPPSAETHPHLFAWFYLVNRFTDAVKGTWAAAGGATKGAEKKPAAPKKEEAKKEEAKKEVKPKEEEDEIDLFGDDTEEDAVSLYLIPSANIKLYYRKLKLN